MRASDAQFTNEQIEYRQAWDAHVGRFYQDSEYDDAEARLKEFLAQKFEVIVEHLSDQVRHVFDASFDGSERMELPDALINRYALTRDDQDVRDDAREEIEERHKGFHCLSSWDGNHGGMTELIKARLNDPDSMETRETRITPVNNVGQHRIIVNFTARNAEGARLADQAPDDVAIVDPVVRRAPQPRHRAQNPAAVEHLHRRRMLTRLDRVTVNRERLRRSSCAAERLAWSTTRRARRR